MPAPQTPPWLDTAAYPFTPRMFDTGEGRLSYVDEGSGAPVVFVHGTPTWSFEWRHLISDLRRDYRCLAPDHLGFGLSDKPTGADLRPEAHARRFAAWVDALGLRDITLVAHDFGGPIGLSYALEHPENVRAVVLLNTWLWDLRGDKQYETPARLFGGALGRFLYLRQNFSARFILPSAFGNRKKLTPAVHRQYLAPLATPADRAGTYACLRALLGSGDWYASLWAKRERLAQKPMLLVWGEKDFAFGPAALARWRGAFPSADVDTLPGVGHWPQEEEPGRVSSLLRGFLARAAAPAPG